MNLVEVGKLLTYVSSFDGRKLSEDDHTAEIWYELPWLRACDYELGKLAVKMFFSQPPNDRGQVPYFDPRYLRYYIGQARRAYEIEEARKRAERKPIEAPAGTYAPPAGWRDQLGAALKRVPDAE